MLTEVSLYFKVEARPGLQIEELLEWSCAGIPVNIVSRQKIGSSPRKKQGKTGRETVKVDVEDLLNNLNRAFANKWIAYFYHK